jgi:hypothetical protein
MDNCVLKPVWSTLKPVILAKFLTGANNLCPGYVWGVS